METVPTPNGSNPTTTVAPGGNSGGTPASGQTGAGQTAAAVLTAEQIMQVVRAEMAAERQRAAAEQTARLAAQTQNTEAGTQTPAGNGSTTLTLKQLQVQQEALVAQLKQRDEALASERRMNAVRAAAQKTEWFDVEDAVRELAGQVTTAADGRLVTKGRQKIGDVEVDAEFGLEESVARLAARKPHWVKAKPLGGTGASGNTGGLGVATQAGAREVTQRELQAGNVDPADILAGKIRLVA